MATGPLPGGGVDLGELVAQAAVRETLEESGIRCAVTGIVGVYSDPRHVILYISDGKARQEFSIVLTARPHREADAEQRVKRSLLGPESEVLGLSVAMRKSGSPRQVWRPDAKPVPVRVNELD